MMLSALSVRKRNIAKADTSDWRQSFACAQRVAQCADRILFIFLSHSGTLSSLPTLNSGRIHGVFARRKAQLPMHPMQDQRWTSQRFYCFIYFALSFWTIERQYDSPGCRAFERRRIALVMGDVLCCSSREQTFYKPSTDLLFRTPEVPFAIPGTVATRMRPKTKGTHTVGSG
jgi:hypothetical protein